jgi:hypothetical protein
MEFKENSVLVKFIESHFFFKEEKPLMHWGEKDKSIDLEISLRYAACPRYHHCDDITIEDTFENAFFRE